MPIDQIGTAGIANGAVVAADLAAGAVTTASMDTSVQPIGVGQTWQDLTASRVAGTTYTNSTGRPIVAMITINATTSGLGYATLSINGVVLSYLGQGSSGSANTVGLWTGTYIIPAGSTYLLSLTGNITRYLWAELR